MPREFDKLRDRGAGHCNANDTARLLKAGRGTFEITQAHYATDAVSVLPRNPATVAAFRNAITIDLAVGHSTNAVRHLRAVAHDGKIDFTMTESAPWFPTPQGQWYAA